MRGLVRDRKVLLDFSVRVGEGIVLYKNVSRAAIHLASAHGNIIYDAYCEHDDR